MPTLEDQMLEEQKKAQLDRKLTLESLFKKWNPIALGCKEEHGATDCPLCGEYWKSDRSIIMGEEASDALSVITCYGCPIRERTGQHACDMTPYDDLDTGETIEERYDLIEAEVEFLISLLSAEDQENLESLHKNWIKEQKNAL